MFISPLHLAMLSGRGGQEKVAAGGGYSAEATQFFSRITDPGTTRKNAYATLIDGLVADGVWSQLDALWILAADISGNAVVNLKSSSFTLANNGATFTADRGYAGNGSTTYLDTGFNPSTAGGSFIQDSAHFSIWNRTTPGATSVVDMGVNGPATLCELFMQVGGKMYGRINDNTGSPTAGVTVSDTPGHYLTERADAATTRQYQNGTLVQTDTTNASNTLPNFNFYICAGNDSGSIFFPSTDQIAAASIGGVLGATKAAALSGRLQTYMTAVGA